VTGRVVCLEGPSAVGKTTLAAALARTHGAPVIAEPSGGTPPPDPAARAAWFLERHVARWRDARAAAAAARFAVLDGDPLKGLWYDWSLAEQGWAGLDVLAPLHRTAVACGELAFPSLYVLLQAPEPVLRARRSGDPTRTRRHFEQHLRLVAPQRRWFEALAAATPGRVAIVETGAQGPPVREVVEALRTVPDDPLDPAPLLEHMLAWLRSQRSIGV
jgi:thymidylate kinase